MAKAKKKGETPKAATSDTMARQFRDKFYGGVEPVEVPVDERESPVYLHSFVPEDALVEAPPVTMTLQARVIYSFPSRSRCPRCKTADTVRVGQTGPKQHRKCRRPTCRYSYNVGGKAI